MIQTKSYRVVRVIKISAHIQVRLRIIHEHRLVIKADLEVLLVGVVVFVSLYLLQDTTNLTFRKARFVQQ